MLKFWPVLQPVAHVLVAGHLHRAVTETVWGEAAQGLGLSPQPRPGALGLGASSGASSQLLPVGRRGFALFFSHI